MDAFMRFIAHFHLRHLCNHSFISSAMLSALQLRGPVLLSITWYLEKDYHRVITKLNANMLAAATAFRSMETIHPLVYSFFSTQNYDVKLTFLHWNCSMTSSSMASAQMLLLNWIHNGRCVCRLISLTPIKGCCMHAWRNFHPSQQLKSMQALKRTSLCSMWSVNLLVYCSLWSIWIIKFSFDLYWATERVAANNYYCKWKLTDR